MTSLATEQTPTLQPQPLEQSAASERSERRIENWIMIYLTCGVLILSTTIMKAFNIVPRDLAMVPAAIGAFFLGLPLFISAARELRVGKPTNATLAALAIIAAMATGNYETAGFLAFILLLAEQVVRRTAWGAQRAIEQLVRLTPKRARLLENGSEREVPIEQVAVGMVVRVRPGENLPVDGTVISGESTVNQASLTGESVPVEVQSKSSVYAGTTNLTGTLEVKVTGVGAESTIGKVTELIREAESSKSPKQMLIEQVAAYFVPLAITVAGLVWYFMSQSPSEEVASNATITAITVLVVMCPSALLLSSPTAMVAAFASAARLGIMIKQTNYLEAASNIDTVVLDKTGTLTTGVFAVSRLAPADGIEGAVLLQAAADAEQQSNHPLARSIMKTATDARLKPVTLTSFEEVHGRGVRAKSASGETLAGRAAWLMEMNSSIKPQVEAVEEKLEGMTGVHVMRDGKYLGAVGLADALRPNAKGVVARLRELGVRRVVILTGDRLEVAKRVGKTVGVDVVEAECLPEEKHEIVRAMGDQGRRVLMVGDGINDGPSLAVADVGVAMGLSGSDIATNSAGVALVNDDLSRVPFLIELARKTRGVVGQNLAASIIIAAIGLGLAATGSLGLLFAAFYHVIGDVFVIGNSFRLIRFGEDFSATHTPVKADAKEAAARPGRAVVAATA